jgi:hypothetical protein
MHEKMERCLYERECVSVYCLLPALFVYMIRRRRTAWRERPEDGEIASSTMND